MKETTASTILWAEAIWHIVILPALSLYLIFCGIVFNVVIVLLLVWG